MNCFLIPLLLWRGAFFMLQGLPVLHEQGERMVTICTERQIALFQEEGREANLVLVSTGRPTRHSTPRGEFEVLYKRWNPVSSTYRVHMPYWQCIEPTGAIGLHQAAPSAEHRLGEALSHGCIRLGRFTARWAYFWLPVGSTVIVN